MRTARPEGLSFVFGEHLGIPYWEGGNVGKEVGVSYGCSQLGWGKGLI